MLRTLTYHSELLNLAQFPSTELAHALGEKCSKFCFDTHRKAILFCLGNNASWENVSSKYHCRNFVCIVARSRCLFLYLVLGLWVASACHFPKFKSVSLRFSLHPKHPSHRPRSLIEWWILAVQRQENWWNDLVGAEQVVYARCKRGVTLVYSLIKGERKERSWPRHDKRNRRISKLVVCDFNT